ncbi:MAG: glycosyltransferase [Anaeromyxobacter sp.]|nr:glycosyltransferase [Anaeromyxobacter sp.]MBL0276541.1 glycosyltransferase [Anaeromyxobacter sp.]
MPQPRVLILHPALAPYRVDMFNALARRCALRVVFLSEAVANQAFDQARLRAQLVEPPGYLLRGLTVAGRTVRLGIGEELRRHRPDVVVTSEFGQATLGVLASRRLAGGDFGHVVATEDNPSSVLAETWLHGLGRRLLQPHVDCVLTYSEEARALYRGRFRASQPVVASPLVQDERVLGARLDEAAGVARAEAAARGLAGRRVLLYVGRLAPEKRVDRLIDAVGRLGAAWPDLRLALVGDGEERARLTARAAAVAGPGRVLFVGRQEGAGLAAWYRLGSVFALASDYEPFGAVVNEALVAGLPVVCSERAGARVLVSPGRTGEVVDADRPEALDAALATWLGRQPPLSDAQLAVRRPSLMESTFEGAVQAWLEALEAARYHRHAPRLRAAG